jgi:hypothetical protein
MSGKSAMRTLVHRAANDRFPPDPDIQRVAVNAFDGLQALTLTPSPTSPSCPLPPPQRKTARGSPRADRA